jgi:hypothetical protein
VEPLESAEDEYDLHQPGHPRLAHKEQCDQYQRTHYKDRVAVTHKVCAENDETEYDRNVERYFDQCCFDHQARCL